MTYSLIDRMESAFIIMLFYYERMIRGKNMPRKILDQKPIPNSSALKTILEQFGEEEVPAIHKRTVEYLRSVSECDPEKAEKIMIELKELGLSEDTAVILLNLLPQDPVEAKALLPPSSQDIDIEVIRKALEKIKVCQEE
jgi:DNA-directed RNA polymerase subunit F